MVLLAIVGALALASIPLSLGWRQGYGEASLARQMGLAVAEKKFDPETFALRTGTGLKFNQLAIGFLAWVLGGFLAGLMLGVLPAFLFGIAGGMMYYGGIVDRRQEYRMQQAREVLRSMQVINTLIAQGKNLLQALEEASDAISGGGGVLQDLVLTLRSAPVDKQADAVREWTRRWENPAVDVVAASLIAYFESRISVSEMINQLYDALSDVVEILGKARATSKGVSWQSMFLAIFPPLVLVLMGILTPEIGVIYSKSPIYLLPVLLGSGLSYWFSWQSIAKGLSIEETMGLQQGQQGIIRVDRMGRVL